MIKWAIKYRGYTILECDVLENREDNITTYGEKCVRLVKNPAVKQTGPNFIGQTETFAVEFLWHTKEGSVNFNYTLGRKAAMQDARDHVDSQFRLRFNSGG